MRRPSRVLRALLGFDRAMVRGDPDHVAGLYVDFYYYVPMVDRPRHPTILELARMLERKHEDTR